MEQVNEILQRTKTEVLVISRNDCIECKDLIQNIKLMQKDITGIKLTVFNIDRHNIKQANIPFKIFITPALFVNGRLKCYGNPSTDKMKLYLSN